MDIHYSKRSTFLSNSHLVNGVKWPKAFEEDEALDLFRLASLQLASTMCLESVGLDRDESASTVVVCLLYSYMVIGMQYES